MARKSPYSPELRQRAIRMVREVRPQYDNEMAAIKSVADKLGIGSAAAVLYSRGVQQQPLTQAHGITRPHTPPPGREHQGPGLPVVPGERPP